RIVRDDARRYLRTDTRHYDVMIGDLFHPDMVGRANLLSLQQFMRARERLNEGGVFVQWLALNQFDIASLQVVLQTFRHAFSRHASDHAMLFIDGYRVALVGMRNVPKVSELLRGFERMDVSHRQDATGGEGFWTWMGRYWGEIPDFSQSSARLQDEWAPVIEFALPKVRYSGGVDARAMWRWLLSWRENDQQAAKVWAVQADDREAFKRAWASAGIDARLWLAELSGDDQQVINWARLSRKANPQDRWPAFALADRMFASLQHGLPDGLSKRRALQRILELRPDHEDAIRAMLRLAMDAGDKEQTDHWRRQLKAVSPLAIDVRGR
ncbi:MAG: spermine synthase, partial [Mariprofundaceae bacterium]